VGIGKVRVAGGGVERGKKNKITKMKSNQKKNKPLSSPSSTPASSPPANEFFERKIIHIISFSFYF
jgi:hypothetical protein